MTRFSLAMRYQAMILPILMSLRLLAASPAAAQEPSLDPDANTGKQWAILIGVENYRLAPPLSFTLNDVDQLEATLRERGGVSARNIVRFVDSAEDEQRRPLLASLTKELPKWFQKPGPNDRLLVYFSGHGFQSADGKLYLAPLDCDPRKPEVTGLSVAWLRDQIAACHAGTKLLVLDSCHAGAEKGDDEPVEGALKSIAAKDLGEPFRDLEGVITLASSTGAEKSQIWSEKRQSLFTYWLNQGLKGHADDDANGDVDIDELNKYVYTNVTEIAQSRFHRPQTPVRIIRSGTPGVPVVLQLGPVQLKHLISDMADQIAWSMESRGIKKVGVLQFTTDTELGEALGGEFGALGRWCSAELEKKLVAAGTFDVIDSRELIASLKKNSFTVDQLGSREALAKLSASLDGLPALVTGTLRHRQHRLITLQTKLKQLESNTLAASAGGTALLNEHEWAMLGHSVSVQPEDRPLPIPGSAQHNYIERLDQKAKGAHPLQDPKFPCRVAIYVDGKERKGEFRGNDYVVPIRNDEIYAVRITLLNREAVYMRLLVDGLNTLPQKIQTRGLDTWEVGPIAKLDEARGWVLDPPRTGQLVYQVDGFVTGTGVDGGWRRFKMVEDGMSLAARKSFTESIGLITAAFYRIAQDRGTVPEEIVTYANLRERRDLTAGDLLSVVNIRYVDPTELNQGR